MSFTVTFYQFAKKYNSTKRPTGGTSFNCVVKNGTGILSPKIELNIGLISDPSAFNYAYIPAFERYYTIREWQFDRTLWTAFLEVDVLATYKTQIGDASLYVLRASGEYDGTVVDNYYPCKVGCSFESDLLTYPYTSGCYVIGVVCTSGYAGSIAYYVVDSANMETLVSHLMDDAFYNNNNGYSLNDASAALQRSIVDPIQYIKSCTWLPFDDTDLTTLPALNGMEFYAWTLSDVSCDYVVYSRIEKSYTFTVKKHPDTNSRGNYVNASPYTLATLNFPPFGSIEIDTSVLATASTLTVNLDIDAFTGEGVLRVSANGILLNEIKGQVGVPVQLAQVKRDYIGAVTSIANGVAGVIGGIAAGGPAGIAGAVAGGVGAVGNAINALTPRSQTIGQGGNFSVIKYQPRLDYQFFRPVDDDIAQNGRPLCKMRQPKNIPGYMLIQDGDVPIPGTITEGEQIRAFLEGGFYYE